MSAAHQPRDAADRLASAIRLLELGGAAHYIPLVRAVHAGHVALLRLARGAGACSVGLRDALRCGRPVLAIIPDDDHASTGPAGFPAARRLFRHARGVVIHAAAGRPDHYADAVLIARHEGFLVLVETASAHADGWRDAAIRAARPRILPMLEILPRAGRAHPVAPVRH